MSETLLLVIFAEFDTIREDIKDKGEMSDFQRGKISAYCKALSALNVSNDSITALLASKGLNEFYDNCKQYDRSEE